jgi:hypothetical protein
MFPQKYISAFTELGNNYFNKFLISIFKSYLIIKQRIKPALPNTGILKGTGTRDYKSFSWHGLIGLG